DAREMVHDLLADVAHLERAPAADLGRRGAPAVDLAVRDVGANERNGGGRAIRQPGNPPVVRAAGEATLDDRNHLAVVRDIGPRPVPVDQVRAGPGLEEQTVCRWRRPGDL